MKFNARCMMRRGSSVCDLCKFITAIFAFFSLASKLLHS